MSQTTLSGELREGTGKNNTPLKWVVPISEVLGGFELDPCASDDSDLAETNIRNTGGLKADWNDYDPVWCNHPYEREEPCKWLSKALETDSTVVTMSKSDTSTEAWNRYMMNADLICTINKRIQFVGEENTADFPVVICVFGSYPGQLRDVLESWGSVIEP